MQTQEIQEKLDKLPLVAAEIGKVIVGQQDIIKELLVSVLAGGHCLLEGVPGLAKTLAIKSLANRSTSAKPYKHM